MTTSRSRRIKVPRPPLNSRADLRAYATEHLVYEIGMFFNAILALETGAAGPPGFFKNASVEALGSHLRNLLCFLYGGVYPIQADDVVAHHFVDGPNAFERWSRARPALSDLLRESKDRTDKELAHLTTKRKSGTPPDKEWPAVGIGVDLLAVLRVFVREANPDYLGGEVAAALPSAVVRGRGPVRDAA